MDDRARILVIDDEIALGEALEACLSGDHDVTVTSSAASALGLLASGGCYDHIFCDLMMPEMNGMEFYLRVRELEPGLQDRIIFMTGGAFTPWASEFILEIGNTVLEKPFDASKARSAVRRASESRKAAARLRGVV